MDHLTLGELRTLLARHTDKPDDVEVRFFIDHNERIGGGEFEPTFGLLTATLDSPEEDGTPAYIGLNIRDTQQL